MLKNYLKNHLTSIFILLFCLYGMTDALAACATPGAPGSPTNSNIGCTSFRANWTAASGTVANYQVDVATTAAFTAGTFVPGFQNVLLGSTVLSLDVTGLSAGTTYYWRVRAYNGNNGGCFGEYASNSLATNTTPCSDYCPSGATNTTFSSITNVTFNTINNSSSDCASYTDFTSISTSVIKTFSYNLTIQKGTTCNTGTYTGRFAAWIDWNNDGDFNDAGELVLSDAAASNGPITVSVTVPAGAVSGTTRMRCIFREGATAPPSCGTYTSWGETEDYTINIIPNNPCVVPTVQPTALSLTPGGTTINGNFTPAVGADSYLVVISTFPTASATIPTNGINYPIGSALSSGYTVIDNDSNTSFTAGGLANNTTYYFYIYAFNNLCVGGPLYLGTSPLNGNATTTNAVPVYCSGVNPSSTSSGVYISKVASVGTILDNSNAPTGYSAGGYGNFSNITIATQVPGGGVNIEMVLAGTYSNPPCNGSSSQFVRAYVDWNKDGDFDDAGEMVFISGTEATPIATAIDNIFGFIVPAGTFPGNYRMRIRTRAYCDGAPITPCGSLPTGETEDYTLAVVPDCNAKITGVTNVTACGPVADVTLLATTNAGTEFRWYTTISGGAPFAVTPTGSLPITGLTTTTTYYVTAYDGVCETIHRTPVVATILPTTELTISPEDAQVCGDQNFVVD